MKIDNRRNCFAVALFFGILLVAAVPALGQVFGKTYEEVLDRAKKEGELRLWWEVPGERGVGEQFEAAFKKRFGFVPRVSLTPVTNPDSILRFLTEVKVGRVDADLLYAGARDIAGRPDKKDQQHMRSCSGDRRIRCQSRLDDMF